MTSQSQTERHDRRDHVVIELNISLAVSKQAHEQLIRDGKFPAPWGGPAGNCGLHALRRYADRCPRTCHATLT